MASLTTRINVTVQATLTSDQTIVTSQAPLTFSKTYSWTDGTAINQANRVFAVRGAVSTGTPVDYDFAGSLTDILGAAVVFAKINAIIFSNRSATAAEIMSIGGDAAGIVGFFGAANDLNAIGPDGIILAGNPSLAGYAVTGTTADVLQVAVAAGTSVAYDLIVIGRSA